MSIISFAFGKTDCLIKVGLHSSTWVSFLAPLGRIRRTALYSICGLVFENAVLENEGKDPRADSCGILGLG